MQMKNLSLCLVLILSAGSVASAANLEAFKGSFLKTTRMVEGKVSLVDGPDSCQMGRLQILLIDEDESVTLMLGAKPLITGLGHPASESKERRCLARESADFSARGVNGHRVLDCGTKKSEFDIQITLLDGGFEYTRKVSSNGKTVLNEVCKYSYGN